MSVTYGRRSPGWLRRGGPRGLCHPPPHVELYARWRGRKASIGLRPSSAGAVDNRRCIYRYAVIDRYLAERPG